MLTYSQLKIESAGDESQLARPVIRTFYDHTQPINEVEFHPFLPILASCAMDNTIKFYDYNSSVKRSFRQVGDTHNVRSISFHPSGDFLLAGTDHNMIRLHDVKAEKVYVNPRTEKNHFGQINMVRFSSDGKLFASVSKDGSIKFWDGANLECVTTITNAHGGMEVTAVQFSRNRKYLLTGGKDTSVCLWDVSTGREIRRIFTSAVKHGQWENRLQTCFNYNEDFILSTDDSTNCIGVWDTRTGELAQKLQGHNSVIRWVSASPTDPHAISCSDDHRARFWVEESSMSE